MYFDFKGITSINLINYLIFFMQLFNSYIKKRFNKKNTYKSSSSSSNIENLIAKEEKRLIAHYVSDRLFLTNRSAFPMLCSELL